MTDSAKPPSGRKMKSRAPPPPQVPQPAPRRIFRTGDTQGGTTDKDVKENMLRPTLELHLTLPQGFQTTVTEDGSKALMDLLVELCSRYHLNPSLHTLELFTPEGHPLGFKPNALLGSLNVACILIKEKVLEEKLVRRPAPKVPEKTVRLMVNYHGCQKAVVRVNPLLPLQDLVPVICDKCEFDPALVVLLKDSISRHELPLDKSLTQLGIKELYVHDKSLVLQPKMASAPALNYSDSIRSSTTSLARAEKKGLLGIFQFSRRKSKTETTSLDMDDCDDKAFQNTEAYPNAMSTMFGAPYVDDRPDTLSQSQSALNISRTSPKAETKKRRAPAPPGIPCPSTEHLNYDHSTMCLGSESQQRKRKAPAPPPTPVSLTSASDNNSAAATPVIQQTETPTPTSRTKLVQSTTVTSVVIQNVTPVAIMTVQPAAYSTCLARSSPTPSSTTSESLAVQDSSSELSQSLEDSEAEPGSRCSTSTGSTVSRPAQAQIITKTSTMEKSDVNMSASDVTSTSGSRSDTESAMNLKMEETENQRHSGVDSLDDRPVPPKPRRSPAQESPQNVLPPSLSSSPLFEPTDNDHLQKYMESAPQSWLHSMQSPSAKVQSMEISTEETVSLGSNSSGSSLPDQGYAASEGMVDGEDSGLVSSPSETHTTSPDGSLSLDGSTGAERLVGTVCDHFSDSDEGCATWGSQHRGSDVTPRLKADRPKDQDLSAQLHQTLADLESDLAEHTHVSKESFYSSSRNSREVPVSVVDLDVPVTTIDEVLPEDMFWTESITNNVPSYSVELQNKNNNAHRATDTSKSFNTETKLLSQQKEKSEKDMLKRHKKKDCILDSKPKEIDKTEVSVKKEAFIEAKSNCEKQKNTNSDIKKEEKKTEKPSLPTVNQGALDSYIVHQNTTTLQSKITPNVTSRFGMKTFTVVPPKPSVVHAPDKEKASTTPGAIKIDEQGNMVKMSQHRATCVSDSKDGHESPLLGKAKVFWSSNEKQDGAVSQNKGLTDKSKGSLNNNKSTWTKPSETTLTTNDTRSVKTFQGTANNAPQIQPKETVEDNAQLAKDAECKQNDTTKAGDNISTNIDLCQSSQKPAVPPPFISEVRKDLFFLKPSRRTSSQYVASAITKYTPKTTFNPDNNSTAPESLLKTQNTGFQKSGRSIQINPMHSFRSSNANNSGFTSNPLGPKRSMSYPEHISDRQKDDGEVVKKLEDSEKTHVSIKGSFSLQETPNLANEQSVAPTHVNGKSSDSFKSVQPRSPSPAPSSSQYTAKSTTDLKDGHKDQNNSVMTPAANHPKPKEKPSVTVSDSDSEPPAVTVFGPVKKFKPVICRSVEKETTLHGSLMEAIQTGGGRERLKKISTSSVSNMKKPSYAEEENERSALMAAIRAQGSTGRLRKTKSEAAEELERFKRDVLEEKGSAQASISSSSSASVQASIPPPAPHALAVAPPPPPPVLPPPKSFSLSQPNVSMNPAMAREEMLEAIRSGSAAERLKKVTVPAKTVQVNGRLGTIKTTSSTMS